MCSLMACDLNMQHSGDETTILFPIKRRKGREGERERGAFCFSFLPARRTSFRTQRITLEIHCKAGKLTTRTFPNVSSLRSLQVKVLIGGGLNAPTLPGYLKFYNKYLHLLFHLSLSSKFLISLAFTSLAASKLPKLTHGKGNKI